MMISHAGKRLHLLYRALEIITSPIDLKERQEQVVDIVYRDMGARGVVFFTAGQEGRVLNLSHCAPWALTESLPPDWELEENFRRVLRERRQPFILEKNISQDRTAKLLTGLGHVLLLPVQDDRNNYHGVIAVILNKNPSADDKMMLEILSRAMASMTRNFAYYRESRQRITELSLLAEVGQIASSIIDTRQLIQTIVDLLCRFLGAASGLIVVKNHSDRYHSAYFGAVPSPQLHLLPDNCANPREDFKRCAYLFKYPEENSVCAALPFKEAMEGYICLFEKFSQPEGKAFAVSDKKLLDITASVIAPAIGNSVNYKRIEELAESNAGMVTTLSSLYEVSNFLLSSSRFRHRVIVLLQALVHPDGFGYEQAIFFEADHKDGELRSVAGMRKDEFKQPRSLAVSLSDLLRQDPEQIIEKYGLKPDLSFSLRAADNPLVKALDKGKVTAPDHLEIRRQLPMKENDMCLILPLASKGQGEGVVALFSPQETVSQESINILKMLADQAEMALASSKTLQNLHQAHRELAEMRNRLLEADRQAALGEIASGMAHEIRNPLMSIGGLVTRARKKLSETDPVTGYLDGVIEEVRRMEKLLETVFNVTSDVTADLVKTKLPDIMDNALDLLGDMLNGIKVEKEYKAGLPDIYCDERLMKQVFFNILLNAVQAVTGKEGRIILRAGIELRDSHTMVTGEVEDNGGGIDPAIMGKVFNPFFTTKPAGSGLGLSYAYGIVSRHNGSIEVHNQGQGASFIVLLPVVM